MFLIDCFYFRSLYTIMYCLLIFTVCTVYFILRSVFYVRVYAICSSTGAWRVGIGGLSPCHIVL